MLAFNINCEAQITISLQQAIDLTLSRNPQIKLAQLNSKLSEENYKQSINNLLPTLTASPQASLNWGRSLDVSTYNYITSSAFIINGTLSTQLILFQGGQLRKQILQNKLILEADESDVSKTKYDLILSTVTAFLQIIEERELLEAAKGQVYLAKLNVEWIQKNYNVGKRSSADLAEVQGQQANSALNQAKIKNQLDISILTLKQLINMPNVNLELIKPDTTSSYIKDIIDTTQILQRALQINPEIKLSMLKRDAAYQNISLTKSSLYPSLMLFGSIGSNFSSARSLYAGTLKVGVDTIGRVNTTNQPVISPNYQTISTRYPFLNQFGDNFYQFVGLSLQIPIFNHFAAQTNIRKAKILSEIAEINTQITISNLTKIVNQAILDVLNARNRFKTAITNMSVAKQILELSEKRFRAGILNAIEYNLAINNANSAEFELIQSKYDYIFKNKIIDYYIGKSF